MTVLRFFLSCVPPKTNHHAKRIVRIGAFSRLADKPELVAAREMLDTLLLPHQVASPLPSPYIVALAFTWPWLKSHSAKFRTPGRQPHTSKPDCDNSSKQICDRLVALRFIEDDQAIAELRIQKWWGDAPGIEIAIAPLAERSAVVPAQPDIFSALEDTHAAHVE